MPTFRERVSAAKQEISIDRGSLYLGIFLGLILAVILSMILPLVFGGLGGIAPTPSEPEPEIDADLVINDLRDSDNRVLIQLIDEPNADSIYVVSGSDSTDYENLTNDSFVGVRGNATVGSTVSVSIGDQGGDVFAQSGDTVQIIGVKDGHTEVLYEFEA